MPKLTDKPYPYNLADALADDGWRGRNGAFDAISASRLESATMTLAPRQIDIINLRYKGGCTYQEIAKCHNITRERVRQIEMRALRLLRHPSLSDTYLCVPKCKQGELERGLAALKEKYEEALLALDENTSAGAKTPSVLLEARFIKLTELNITVRTYNCLNRAGIKTLGDIAACTETDLFNVRNLGAKSIDEIREVLTKHGLSLKGKDR